jgi:acyl carrier protein
MTSEQILDKLNPLFRDVLDDPSLVITEKSSGLNVPNWDSLSHINIIESVQDEFKVKFALGELQDLKDVGELVRLIQAKAH